MNSCLYQLPVDYLLTIITVTKNCVTTIDRTLKSVSAVKTDVVEFIVVDGGSSDGTLEILRSRGTLIDNLKSEPDTGIYNAMNKGVRQAQGRYVVFLNGDDEFIPEGVRHLLSLLRGAKEKIICTTTLVGDSANPSETLIPYPSRLPFFNSIPHPSAFVSRELLLRHPFREGFRIAADYDFFLNMYLNKKKFKTFPIVTALHRRDGASSDINRSKVEVLHIRRARLGPYFHYIESIAIINRFRKRIFKCFKKIFK